jgi:hypothetical protein
MNARDHTGTAGNVRITAAVAQSLRFAGRILRRTDVPVLFRGNCDGIATVISRASPSHLPHRCNSYDIDVAAVADSVRQGGICDNRSDWYVTL